MNYLKSVRDQYEQLPYPTRNPDDEKKRLLTTWLDSLEMINHYCFRGEKDFSSGFRVLVAGGGTGDGTIYLAEQLKGTNAEIVHLDLSQASIDLAKRRAEVRGLSNIVWVRDSLLNIPLLDLGTFDYINCVGVLHHLAEPNAGLQSVLSVLKEDGALGVMLYGQIARTGVYQFQELLRLINSGDDSDVDVQLDRAKAVLSSVPKTNPFKLAESLFFDHLAGDFGLYDLLLHSQDRAYTVAELYDWLVDGLGLNISLTYNNRGISAYLPDMMTANKAQEYLAKLRKLPLRQQFMAGELFSGAIKKHSFYITRTAGVAASYGDVDCVPFYFNQEIDGKGLAEFVETEKKKGGPVRLFHEVSGAYGEFDPGVYSKYILGEIDGIKSFAEIFAKIRSIEKFKKLSLTDQQLFLDFEGTYQFFRAIDRLLLRKKGLAS